MQSFPEKFKSTVLNDPFLEGEILLEALNTISPVAIRFNPFKKEPVLTEKKCVLWCENAFYLNERPVYTLDPLFHAGC